MQKKELSFPDIGTDIFVSFEALGKNCVLELRAAEFDSGATNTDGSCNIICVVQW